MTLKGLYKKSVLLLKSAQIPTPAIDARVIIEHSLNINTRDFYSTDHVFLSAYTNRKTLRLIKRRAKHEPVAYLIGKKEFFGLDFFVDKNVLIPRPESEWLVEKALKKLSAISNSSSVLDLGTGSGNIIISIVKFLNNNQRLLKHKFFASDISNKALVVAKKNAKLLNISNINFIHSDLFSNRLLKNNKFDLIIANLPYVPFGDADISTKYEPESAIFSSDNGAAIIKIFLKEAKKHINIKGLILIELDPRNAQKIKNCAKENFPNAIIELNKDLASLNRYLTIQSNQA